MKRVVLAMLGAYKRFISPALPNACRFVPTCSEYAMEAVEGYGILRGLMLSAWRLLRCHPFARGGYDAVPVNGIQAINFSVKHISAKHVCATEICATQDDLALRRCCPTLK